MVLDVAVLWVVLCLLFLRRDFVVVLVVVVVTMATIGKGLSL